MPSDLKERIYLSPKRINDRILKHMDQRHYDAEIFVPRDLIMSLDNKSLHFIK